MENSIKENKMGTMPVFKLLVSISAPLMLSMLIQALYNIVDSIYVAKISESALSALTLAFPIQMLMSAFAVGTSVGVNSLVSRRLGAGRIEEANRAAGNGVLLSFASSLLFVAAGLFAVTAYFSFAGRDATSPDIITHGIVYLRTVLTFCPAIFLGILFEKLLQATGRAVLSMLTQLAGAITNIILDPIMIFGKYGVRPMGVYGAAAATVIGQFVTFTVGLVFLMTLNKPISIRPRHLKPEGAAIKGIYAVALPAIIMQSLASANSMIMNKVMLRFSDSAVAVLGAFYKLNSFIFMPVFGLNSGTTPITGFNYGARNRKRIVDTAKYGVITSVAIMTLGALAFIFLPEMLFSLFDASESMLAIGIPAFRAIALSFIPAGASIILNGVFQGIGAGYLSMITTIIRSIGVLIPAAYLFASLFGIDGVWWAYLCAEAVGLIVTLFMYRYAYRKYIKPLEEPANA